MKLSIAKSLLVVIFSGIFSAGDATDAPTVTTLSGTVAGSIVETSEGVSYRSFLGIPYAVPITSDTRFEIASAVEAWEDTLDATTFGSSCVQVSLSSEISGNPTVIGSEDCLTLNVYAPSVSDSSTDSWPVIVFLHGGAFQYGGSSSYGADYLLNEDVVLVTVNYRLGPFGFLSTEDCTVSGNMGLKDQLLALNWIQSNIASFGGNPEKIALIGQGAGGASAHYHLLTSQTEGLYSGVMALSGSAVDPWALTESSLEKAEKLATIVGCTTTDVDEMVACLRTTSAEDIALATVQFKDWVLTPSTPFGPVIESASCDNKFIEQAPITSINSNSGVDRPIVYGTVAKEGLGEVSLFINNDTLLDELDADWDTIAPALLDYEDTISTSDQSTTSSSIREQYFGSSSISSDTIEALIRVIGTRLYKADTGEAAQLQAQNMQSTVQLYVFGYRGDHSMTEIFTGTTTDYGVAHGDDIFYTLKLDSISITSDQDLEMQKILVKLWTSFATNAVPDVGVTWTSLGSDSSSFELLRIDAPDNIYVRNNTDFGDHTFWDTIDFDENVV